MKWFQNLQVQRQARIKREAKFEDIIRKFQLVLVLKRQERIKKKLFKKKKHFFSPGDKRRKGSAGLESICFKGKAEVKEKLQGLFSENSQDY